MKRYYIGNATLIQQGSSLHKQKVNMLLDENGYIAKIDSYPFEESLASDVIKLNDKDMYMSLAWVDTKVTIPEPGLEYKESFQTGAKALLYGGFAWGLLNPEKSLLIHSKTQVDFIKQMSHQLPIDFIPMGSFNSQEGNMAELFDLSNSGCTAFTSSFNSYKDDSFLLNIFEYANHFNFPIVVSPIHPYIGVKGMMNEGDMHIRLGLKGITDVSEEIMIQKLISLSEYTHAKVHISGISSLRSLPYLSKAKDKGLAVTSEVFIANLLWDETSLHSFDSNYKHHIPLRTEEDKLALREAVLNGLIDVICSNHEPQDWDAKTCEFQLAEAGIIATQTLFSSLIDCLGADNLDKWLPCLEQNPKKIFNIVNNEEFKEGATPSLTIFSTSKKWAFNKYTNYSKSQNTPLYNNEFVGKPILVSHKSKVHFLDEN